MNQKNNKAFWEEATGGTGVLPMGNIATGFDFEPLPNGDVLIEFFGDDGVTFNSQVITRDCLARIPIVVHAFFLAVDKGTEEALDFLNTTVLEERQQQ